MFEVHHFLNGLITSTLVLLVTVYNGKFFCDVFQCIPTVVGGSKFRKMIKESEKVLIKLMKSAHAKRSPLLLC